MVKVENHTVHRAQNIYYDLVEKKLTYDFKALSAKMDKLIHILEGYSLMIDKYDIDEKSKLNSTIKFVKKTSLEILSLREELDTPFLLFVMGMGKMGKSTLVNALIGEELAIADALPSTWKIDMFQGTDEYNKNATIVFSERSPKTMNRKSAIQFIEEEEEKTKKSKEIIRNQFREKKKLYKGNKDALIELQDKLKEDLSKITSDIVEVKWDMRKNTILSNFTIVDTPGLKQELFGNVTESAKDYYYKSDGALWIIDANKLASKEQMELLAESESLYKDKKQKVIGVINRIDNVRKNGGEEAVEKVVLEARKIYGSYFKTIVPISAKQALEGVINNDEYLLELSGLKRLQKEINRSFLNTASEIKVASKRNALDLLIRDLEIALKELIQVIEEENISRNQLVEKSSSRINDIKEVAKQSIDVWLESYKGDVNRNINSVGVSVLDYSEDRRKRYFNDSIFEVSSFEEKTGILLYDEQNVIFRLSEELSEENTFKKFKYINEKHFENESKENTNLRIQEIKGASFDNEAYNWIAGIGVTYLVSALLGPIGILAGVAVGVFGIGRDYFRENKVKKIKQKCRQSLDEAVGNIRRELYKKVDEWISEINSDIEYIREKTFEEVYLNSSEVEKWIELTTLVIKEINSNNMQKKKIKDFIFLNTENAETYINESKKD